jgi:hypothetical protein
VFTLGVLLPLEVVQGQGDLGELSLGRIARNVLVCDHLGSLVKVDYVDFERDD